MWLLQSSLRSNQISNNLVHFVEAMGWVFEFEMIGLPRDFFLVTEVNAGFDGVECGKNGGANELPGRGGNCNTGRE